MGQARDAPVPLPQLEVVAVHHLFRDLDRGLVVVRFAWEGFAWTVPYFVFWAWVIALAIRLIARPTFGTSTPEARRLAG